eukprot:14485225-Alexandrium_andersonii.AAC.1
MGPRDTAAWQQALLGQGQESSTRALQASTLVPMGEQRREAQQCDRLARSRAEQVLVGHTAGLQGTLDRGDVPS